MIAQVFNLQQRSKDGRRKPTIFHRYNVKALQQQLLPRWVCFMFQNGEVLSEERFNIISMKATVEFQVDKFLKDQKADVACQICKSTGKVAAYRGKKKNYIDVGDE